MIRKKPLKFDNFKRGDRVFAYDLDRKSNLYKGVIARISQSKDTIYIERDDGRHSYGAPRINNKRTWKCYMYDDGTGFWKANTSWGDENTRLYFDRIDDWQSVMKEV